MHISVHNTSLGISSRHTALFSFDKKIAFLTCSRLISILRDETFLTITGLRSDRAVSSRNELSYVSLSGLLIYVLYNI